MKLPLMLIFLSLSSQIGCMNIDSVMSHLSSGDNKPNPIESLMNLRTIEEFKKNDIKNVNAQDKRGNTILHYTVGPSWDPKVLLAYSKMIDCNAKNNDGRTPMHALIYISALYEKKDIENNLILKYKYLMQAGALLFIRDNYGKTPVEMLKGASAISKDLPPGLKKLNELVDADLKKIGHVHSLIKKDLATTNQQYLLSKFPTKKAAL